MIKNSLVSIIIPCYNSEKYIKQTIDSVISQDYPNIEIIVIDDGSIDESLKVISGFDRFIKIISTKNLGACNARNLGMFLSSGEFITFLDADDVLPANSVSIRMENIFNFDVIFGNELYYKNFITNQNFSFRRTPKPKFKNDDFANLFFNYPITSSALIRKSIIKNNLWNNSLKSGQEYFFWLTLCSIGAKFKYINQDTACIRIHDSVYRISNQNPYILLLSKINLIENIFLLLKVNSIKRKRVLIEFNKLLLNLYFDSLHFKYFDLSIIFKEYIIKKHLINKYIIKEFNFKLFTLIFPKKILKIILHFK
jgi:glycosyltransferase involved in cell wall biosynthesis